MVQCLFIGHTPTTTSAAQRTRAASARAAPPPDRQPTQWRACVRHANAGCSLEAAAYTSEHGLVPRKIGFSLVQFPYMWYGLIRKRPPQLGTPKLGSTQDAIARPYACNLDGLSPKGTQGKVLWTLSEPDMRLLVVRVLRAVLWHSTPTWNRAVCKRFLAEPSRSRMPTLVRYQWPVTVVHLARCLGSCSEMPFLSVWLMFWQFRGICDF